MNKIVRNLKSFSGMLIMLMIGLIVLFFLLNLAAQKGWGPLAGWAGWAESHANGTAYENVAAPVVGVPHATNGPAL